MFMPLPDQSFDLSPAVDSAFGCGVLPRTAVADFRIGNDAPVELGVGWHDPADAGVLDEEVVSAFPGVMVPEV